MLQFFFNLHEMYHCDYCHQVCQCPFKFKLKILSHFDDIETYNTDDLYVAIYKLSGLYNAVENQQQKIMQEMHKREMEVEENVR